MSSTREVSGLGLVWSGTIRRAITVGGLIAAIAVAGACADSGDSAESGPAGDSEERQDPAAFAAQLMEFGISGNWEDVRPLLAEPFDEYDTEALRSGLAFPRWPEALTEPAQWEIDEHEDFTVARSADSPHLAMTLLPDDDSWRYDPGGRAMMRIERRIAGLESSQLPRETNGMPGDAPYQSTIQSDTRASDIHPHFQRQLGPVVPEGEDIAITLHMTVREVEAAQLPLAGIRARDEDGEPLDSSLTGTTAVIEDGMLIMPVGEGGDGDSSAPYEVSLSVDRPEASDATFELTFADLELIEPRSVEAESLEFDLHYENLSAETLPGFLKE